MTGRVFVVTGANSGIGYETSRHLCEGGNDVILACRNEDKGKAAVERILKENPNALATFMQLDLTDMESIRKFVDDFHETGKKLHVLINNAGVYLSGNQRQFTKNNFELTMGTNHLGPFLLTNLLLEDLKKTAGDGGDCRIVTITSSLHDPTSKGHRKGVEAMDMENFFLEKQGTYSAHQAYKNSKLANVCFSYRLASELEGSGVSSNVVCPGFVPNTGLNRHATVPQRFFCKWVLGGVLKFMKITRTLDQATKTVVEMACGEKVKDKTGKFFQYDEEAKSSEESMNEELQKNVWDLSGRYCHLEGFEPLDAPVPPPPEETPKKSKSKKEKKEAAATEEKAEEETAKEGEEEKKEEDEEKKDEDKKDETEEKKEEESKPEETKEENTDDLKKDVKPAEESTPEITAQ